MTRRSKPGKHLTLTWADDGSLESVSVSTPLELVYERLLEDAEESLGSPPLTIAKGIPVIIFGAFWVEATTNNVTKEMLWRKLGKSLIREYVWRQVKKSSTFDKLNFIAGLCTTEEANALRALAPQLQVAFELRNRLAHFRAEEELVGDAPDNFAELLRNYMQLPETQLESVLTDLAVIREHAATFRSAADWLASVRSTKAQGQLASNESPGEAPTPSARS